jgi:hypothetical protein
MKSKDRRIKIGTVGVDSGTLLICDPCYIHGDNKIMDEITELMFNQDQHTEKYVQLNHNALCSGKGVAFQSGLGDGSYDVFATIGKVPGWGERIKKVEIVLIGDE